jgi:aspartyl-tRNA(Asn)/glutamyl-tRNA(Gln) amidotransferase subunit B
LPDAKASRFGCEYGLADDDIAVLVEDRGVARYFEEAVGSAQELGVSPKSIANWMTGELFRLVKAAGIEFEEAQVAPGQLAELVTLVETGTITSNSGKAVLAEMFATGRSGAEIVRDQGLAQVSDEATLVETVAEVLAANPDQVTRYRSGKVTLLQWFVGQVMRTTRGKANPQVVTRLLRERLEE